MRTAGIVPMPADERLLANARALLVREPLSEEDLARRLYGVVGSVAPWVAVLRRLLVGQDDLYRDDEGRWNLRRRVAGTPLLMSGRSTRARGGRLLALALAPLETLHPVWLWRFSIEQRTADYLRRAAALDDAELGAVPFIDVAPEIADIIRDRELLVLDGRLPSLLSMEFELSDLVPPGNTVRELGHRLWEGHDRKRSLVEVRQALGLPAVAGDELVGELEVLRCLAERHPETEPQRSARVTVSTHRERLRSSAWHFPESPGVYIFKSGSGGALYVGSAVNLRRRALSYFGNQIELTRGLRGLIEESTSLEYVAFGTHLEAVLEEAALIAGLLPRYNVQRTVSARAAWLRIGAEAPANVAQVATAPRPDSALYLGPLPNRVAVAAVANVLAALWGFRRRGGSAKTDPASLQRLEEMGALLADPERFCAEVRARYHSVSVAMPASRATVLREHVERTERAALSGELVPTSTESRSALVARLDPVELRLHLLLVRDLVPVACAVVAALDEPGVERTVAHLLSIPSANGGPEAAPATLAARWLHAHRQDPWVLSLQPEVEPASVLSDLVRAELEARETVAPPHESPWWLDEEE